MFTEEGWKNMVKESSLSMPKEDLAVGKGWTSKGTVPLGPGLSLTLDKTLHISRCHLEYREDQARGEDDPGRTRRIRTSRSSSWAPRARGPFLFDNTKGRIVSAEVTQKIGLHLKAGANEDTRSTEVSNVMTLVDGK